jgi:hypothetical protein
MDMYCRKVIVMATAVFALGAAFAAQPTSEHADQSSLDAQQPALWIPGTDMLMSTGERANRPLAPPQ